MCAEIRKILAKKLRGRHIYVTYNRVAVLEALYCHKTALSVSDITRLFSGRPDRISVYRTLQIFLGKGMVCSVPGTKGDIRYILIDESSGLVFNPRRSSLYLTCIKCGSTQLLKQPAPALGKMPGNFEVKRYDVILEGLCDNCKTGML
jgi:Fur family transcriptional regulator, ferric uptake regulator